MRLSRSERLALQIPGALRRDADGHRGRTGYVDALLREIIYSARAEGRREARPPGKVQRGLVTLASVVDASCAAMVIGRENDAKLSREEARAVAEINAACEWIRDL